MILVAVVVIFFFFNDTATTEIYTLSLHDALPICAKLVPAGRQDEDQNGVRKRFLDLQRALVVDLQQHVGADRSEEHTSELQSQSNLVCRLLLEKKKQEIQDHHKYQMQCVLRRNML